MSKISALTRKLLLAGCAALVLPVAAQTYPDRPIRLVVPYAPGGGADMIARMVGDKLGQRLGQPVIVDNRPGAGTQIGGEHVAKSPADGYTLMLSVSSMTLLPLRKGGSSFDLRTDFTPISTIAETPYLILANPKTPFKTLKDMLDHAKANPGQLNYGINGVGTGTHLVGEYFSQVAGIKMTPVPYKGSGPQTTALLGGEIPLSVDGTGPMPHVLAGRLIVLATTGSQREPQLPDVPTVSEVLPGLVLKGWYGLVAPKGLPAPILEKVHGAIVEVVGMPDVQERLRKLSLTPTTTQPSKYAEMISEEFARWQKTVQDANIVIQ